VSRYQKGKTNLDFTQARDSEWQWHQPGRMQVCTSLQTDNHASTPLLSFLQAGCPSCRPTNSVKAPKVGGVCTTCSIKGRYQTHGGNYVHSQPIFIFFTVRFYNIFAAKCILKYPTAPPMRRCTTWQNINVRK